MKKIKKRIKIKDIVSIIFIMIGALIAAFSLECFLVPNSILDGGVTGISIILNLLFNFKLSILIFLINIPFVYIGYKNLGKSFLWKTIFSILMFSIFLEIFNHLDFIITKEILLATIYGSVLLGFGVGLVIKFGGCLDGTESLGIVISKKTNISVGQFVLFCNIIIFSIAGIFFGIDRAMYSLLAYFITSKIVDLISEGLDNTKVAMIICDNGDLVSKEIYKSIGRTVTFMKGKGFISGNKDILYSVLTRLEITELRRIIKDIDGDAFVTILDASEIIGKNIKSVKKK